MSYYGDEDGSESYEERKGRKEDGGVIILEVVRHAVIAAIFGEHRDRKEETLRIRAKSLML